MTEVISYSKFLWDHVLTESDKQSLLTKSDKGSYFKVTSLKTAKYDDDVEIFLLHDLDANQWLKNYIKKNEKMLESKKADLSKENLKVSDLSAFHFQRILYSDDIEAQEVAKKLTPVSFLNQIRSKFPGNKKLIYKHFKEELSDGVILTVKGYFPETFNRELVSLMAKPKIWFVWDNIEGDTRIFNTLEEIKNDFDESAYRDYKEPNYYYQIGVLIEEDRFPEHLRPNAEKFYRLISGAIDKAEFLEPNEFVEDALYGVTLLEGIPSLIGNFLEELDISKDIE